MPAATTMWRLLTQLDDASLATVLAGWADPLSAHLGCGAAVAGPASMFRTASPDRTCFDRKPRAGLAAINPPCRRASRDEAIRCGAGPVDELAPKSSTSTHDEQIMLVRLGNREVRVTYCDALLQT